MSITVKDIVIGSLQEIQAISGGDLPSAEDLVLGVTLFNEMLDSLNADQRAVYASTFTTYTITANLQPHTIGVTANSPTWTVTGNRPESVDGANLVLTNTTPYQRLSINLRDRAWWLAQMSQGVTSGIPTDLYYEPKWPNGSVYLWPVPTVAYGIELECRIVLTEMLATDTFTLPPGYREALRLTLAEKMATAFDLPVPPMTSVNAREARARVWANNDVIPRLASDAGPISNASVSGGSRSNWNWLNGSVQ